MQNNTKIKDSWKTLFTKYNNNYDEEKSLNNILDSLKNTEYNIYPKGENTFKCFEYFESNKTNIVILGQDPYHRPDQATGLCFGINENVVIPPSLKNIIKELKNDLNITLTNNSLENWAQQNILMLNASLSVIEGKPNSQATLWSDFTDFIIDELNKNEEPIIFVAWGAFAHNKLKNIDTSKHYLIVSSHPSPLSVYKKYKTFSSFQGSKPFSQINEILQKNKKTLINF
jgi:uracil-DNA glycosylase|tara:strand:+ start:108 stop:794 length:687 start_codon:yes stop_codon:yes gene_type:complete